MSHSADTVRELQAEVERLRAQVDQLAKIRGKQIPALWAENDRLRAELANKHGGDGSVLHVTRESQDALYADRDRARAEVERLRGALEARPKVYFPVEETAREVDQLLKAIDVAEKNTEDRQAEVERLRGERDIEYQRAEAYKDEVERLRAEQDNAGFIPWRLAQDSLDEYAAEVERLRAQVESYKETMKNIEAGDWNGLQAEVERLRAENEYHIETIDYLRPLEAEVDRLKETLLQMRLHREADMPGTADAWMYSEELRQAEAEVERLRKQSEENGYMALAAQKEVERLRERLEELANDPALWTWAQDIARDALGDR